MSTAVPGNAPAAMPQQAPRRSRRAIGKALGEAKVTRYEQASSWLVSLLVMVGGAVALLLFAWVSFKLHAPPIPTLVELTEEDFGGYENGVLGESMQIDGPITEEISQESDLTQDPSIEKVVAAMVDAVATMQADLDNPLLNEDFSDGGQKSGSIGDGNAPALGEGGGGKGGVRRGTRWIIKYMEGGALEEYARQLDFFRIELGVMTGQDEVHYAAGFAGGSRNWTGKRSDEKRLFFTWREGKLQQADRQLLQRGGVNPAGKAVLQFYQPDVENLLANIEMQYLNQRYPGRNLRQVRRTHFQVRANANGYEFFVTEQTYF